MKEIELLAIEANPGLTIKLQELLYGLRHKQACNVNLNMVRWENAWRKLVEIGIYQHGADVSEVGTSWLESLAAMNAVRPISVKEVSSLGGEKTFLPATWQSVSKSLTAEADAIPFRADARVIFYWKDMIEVAGLDPCKIFCSVEGMLADMESLQRVCPTPWGVTTQPDTRDTLYHLASWVWGMEGDFIEPDGKQLALTSSQALEGIRSYYALGRFLPKIAAYLSDDLITNLFLERKIAAMMSGPWFFSALRSSNRIPDQASRIGIVSPPGPSFVGGTSLVLWRHCKLQECSLDLINFLTSPRVQAEYCAETGLLPVRQDAWMQPPFSTDPHYQAMYQALLHGRAFRPVSLWGLIEDRLTPVLGQIWIDLQNDPAADLSSLLRQRLEPVVHRLNIMLNR